MIPYLRGRTPHVARPAPPVTLIEPDEAVRAALTALLEGRGWQVLALGSAEHLDDSLNQSPPFAVVCESTLPDTTAIAVLDLCRDHRIPVVFLGHKMEVQSAVDLVRMGAHDFLEKPFPQARLLKLLDNLAQDKIY